LVQVDFKFKFVFQTLNPVSFLHFFKTFSSPILQCFADSSKHFLRRFFKTFFSPILQCFADSSKHSILIFLCFADFSKYSLRRFFKIFSSPILKTFTYDSSKHSLRRPILETIPSLQVSSNHASQTYNCKSQPCGSSEPSRMQFVIMLQHVLEEAQLYKMSNNIFYTWDGLSTNMYKGCHMYTSIYRLEREDCIRPF
jgi:hypothetical protein